MTRSTQYAPNTMMPHLCVRDITGALAFYQQAFRAREIHRLIGSGGRIVHAEIKIGETAIDLAEEEPDNHNLSPQLLGGSPVVIGLYVEDVDAAFKQAIAAGAKTLFPVNDQFYGDRSGRLVDPFGHMWSIATHQEDVSPEEMQRRFNAHLKQ
jgi:PhnB protein